MLHEGLKDCQISPPLLAGKGIEATEKLADSKNSKVVVSGNPKNGLPLILGQENGRSLSQKGARHGLRRQQQRDLAAAAAAPQYAVPTSSKS